MAFLADGPADVVDGQVLLAQGDDPVPQRVGLGGRLGPFGGGQEERTLRRLTKLVDHHPHGARGVAEAFGDLGRRTPLHEEGPQGFVLAVGGIGRFQEVVGFLASYL